MTPTLYLVGLGIHSTLHITEEARQALKACRKAFCLLDDPFLLGEVGRLCGETVDLIYLYEHDVNRSDIYTKISEIVINAAKGDGAPVALVCHGHPMFLVSAAEKIIEKAEENGLNVHICSAISSLDTLFTDLRVDLGYAMQVYDATTLLLEEYKIDSRVPLVLFQIANTLNIKTQTEKIHISILDPLFEYLRKYYPPDHELIFVHSANRLLMQSSLFKLKMNDRAQLSMVDLWTRPTLYVKPC